MGITQTTPSTIKTRRKRITDQQLIDELVSLAKRFGRQPRWRELKYPYSKYSHIAYLTRFGSYEGAIRAAGLDSLPPAPRIDRKGQW